MMMKKLFFCSPKHYYVHLQSVKKAMIGLLKKS